MVKISTYYDSFTYNGVNMLERFGIKMLKHNGLLPPLRPRKIQVMNRSGSYDFGARTHDERVLRLDCQITRQLELLEMDQLKYTLSRKGKIILWDMPERHFVGQIYNPNTVIEHFMQASADVSMEFICNPYVEGILPVEVLAQGPYMPIDYKGTWKTPTRFTIRNTSSTQTLRGITITSKARKQ